MIEPGAGERWSAGRIALILALATGVLVAVLVPLGFPVPQVDDAWFKGPAAELATHGRLASPGITGFFPRIHLIFACYPPLPQGVLSVWYRVFGVSLTASITYSLLIHAAFAIGVAATAVRTLAGSRLAPRDANLAALATGLAWLANLALLDRQEEFGLIWLWASIALVPSPGTWATAAASGAFVGLASLCSPWAGMLSAVAITLRTAGIAWLSADGPVGARLHRAAWFAIPRWAASGAVAASFFGAWIATIEHLYPGVFREQFLGAMQYAAKDAPYPSTLTDLAATYGASVGYSAWLLPALLITLISAPIALTARARAATRADPDQDGLILAVSLGLAGVIGLAATLFLRPSAYTYCWASIDVMGPCLAVALARYLADAGNRRLGLALTGVIVALAWGDPLHNVVAALSQPADERPNAVFARLQSEVPPGVEVAVSARHWLAFQGRNPWRDVLFLTHRDPKLVDDCDWLVLRDGKGSDLPPFIGDFDRIDQIPTDADDRVTYAFSLWHRRGAPER